MKTRTELITSLENEVDLCFEAKKMCDNDGPPYWCILNNNYLRAQSTYFPQSLSISDMINLGKINTDTTTMTLDSIWKFCLG